MMSLAATPQAGYKHSVHGRPHNRCSYYQNKTGYPESQANYLANGNTRIKASTEVDLLIENIPRFSSGNEQETKLVLGLMSFFV